MRPPGERKRRSGCLGCFGTLVLGLLLGVGLVVIVDGLFAPWAFFLGGSFHILPYWQGWGRMHSQSSGDYLIYLWVAPAPSKYDAYMRGYGELCTPRGERYRMRISASMNKHIGRDMNGQPIRISGYYQPWNWQFINDRRPRVAFQGQWKNPNILLSDRGTLLTEFKPDGTLYPDKQRPAAKEIVQFTLNQGGHADYDAACAAQTR